MPNKKRLGGSRPSEGATGVAPWLALLLALAAGIGLGFAARSVFFEAVGSAPQLATRAPGNIRADPRDLVVQPSQVPASYALYADTRSTDPANTNAKARYVVALSREGSPKYLAECGVSLYATPEQAAAALHSMLSLGSYGTELPPHESLGEEAHLFAARDSQRVIGSVLWRDRNAVAFVFVYNPYAGSTPSEELDQLARGNAYDDTLGFAYAVEDNLKKAGG